MKSRAFWYPQRHAGQIVEEDLPPLDDGMCLIRTFYSAISPGTERIVFSGEVPDVLREEMRCPYMGGEFPFPVKYGYSLVGEVVAGPPKLLHRIAHVLHPHQTAAIVRCEDLLCLPESVPAARGTLLSNMETAINAVWDSTVRVGDRALVVGFGTIGSLVTRLLAGIAGVEVDVTETDPLKLKWASEMGFSVLRDNVPREYYDIAFNASSTAEGLQTAIDAVGTEGRVIELSWYGTHDVHIFLGDTFHSRRKSIICSQVSTIPAVQTPRWDHRRRKRLAARLLTDAAYDEHIRHEVQFEELPAFFEQLIHTPSSYLSVLVNYS